MRLGEAMVKESLITNDQLARALERQIIFGGRLGTNLVEMGAVSEETLAQFLGKVLRVPYADPACFEDVSQEVRDAVPPELAEKYTCFPIKRERSRVHLAMKDPGDMALVDELRFIVGLDIKPYIASEIRIVFALEKYYGIKRDLRYISVLDEEPQKPFAPPPQKAAQEAAEVYLGDESQEEAYAAPAYQPPLAAQPPPPPAPPVSAPVAAVAPVLQPPPVAAPAPARRGPIEVLMSPDNREQVAGAVVEGATAVLARAVIFIVKGNVITGWRAAGTGLTDETAGAVGISLDEPSIFKEVVLDKLYYKGPVLQVPQNTKLLVGLGGVYPQEAVAFPLVIKGKVVGVLYGDNGQGALITGDVDELRRLMARASMSLEILILKNKILSGA